MPTISDLSRENFTLQLSKQSKAIPIGKSYSVSDIKAGISIGVNTGS